MHIFSQDYLIGVAPYLAWLHPGSQYFDPISTFYNSANCLPTHKIFIPMCRLEFIDKGDFLNFWKRPIRTCAKGNRKISFFLSGTNLTSNVCYCFFWLLFPSLSIFFVFYSKEFKELKGMYQVKEDTFVYKR